MTPRLVLLGAGGHAKVVADVARAAGWQVVGLVETGRERIGQVAEPGGAKVIYDEAEFWAILAGGAADAGGALRVDAAIVAFGANQARLEATRRLEAHLEVPTLIHPSASISPSATLGAGTVVMPQVVVNASARIGEAAILNTACVVEHDCVIGSGSHLSPRATLAGGVRVGELSWLGAGATVINNLTLGTGVTVGAGAVVIRDVADSLTVVGCPARPARSRTGH